MKKTFAIAALFISTTAMADNQAFQEFDNQFNIGYGVTSGTLSTPTNGAGNVSYPNGNATYNTQLINLDLEHLFNNNIWFDVDTQLTTYQGQSAALPPGSVGSSNPFYWGLNGKLGYAFQVVPDHLQLIPYATAGLNSNYSAYSLQNGANLTNDYFYTTGVGGRIEYRINKIFDIYGDQSIAYNFDQAPTTAVNAVNMNHISYVTQLGAKFNVYQNLQLGVNAFYTYYQPNTALPGGLYVPSGQLGAIASIGLTY